MRTDADYRSSAINSTTSVLSTIPLLSRLADSRYRKTHRILGVAAFAFAFLLALEAVVWVREMAA